MLLSYQVWKEALMKVGVMMFPGSARQVWQRTVAYGKGWMPTRSTPETIKQGRAGRIGATGVADLITTRAEEE
jgi:hypothetical protein